MADNTFFDDFERLLYSDPKLRNNWNSLKKLPTTLSIELKYGWSSQSYNISEALRSDGTLESALLTVYHDSVSSSYVSNTLDAKFVEFFIGNVMWCVLFEKWVKRYTSFLIAGNQEKIDYTYLFWVPGENTVELIIRTYSAMIGIETKGTSLKHPDLISMPENFLHVQLLNSTTDTRTEYDKKFSEITKNFIENGFL